MAEDARLSTSLPTHPKTRKLEKRLGPAGCWSLVRLFLWVASDRWDGDLHGLSDEDIELAAHWEGDPGTFVKVLAEVRFLDGDSGAYVIHDWAEHNPYAAGRGKRIETGKLGAAARWGKEPSPLPESTDATSMPLACSQHRRAMPPPLHSTPKTSLSDEKQSDVRKAAPSRDAEKLAQLLADQIFANKPDAKPTAQAQLRVWAKIADQMIRIDQRSPERIEGLIRWVQADEFWKCNILSMAKLREKFDQVELKARHQAPPKASDPKVTNWRIVTEEELAAKRKALRESGVTQ